MLDTVKTNNIILASASPRRKQLLAYLIDNFDVKSADIDESVFLGEKPSELVERLAKMKAQVIALNNQESIVIGSDTVVACDNEILGKPKNFEDFKQMMTLLSNQWHQVFTGVSVQLGEQIICDTIVTDVKMVSISSQNITDYWRTNEPLDKAGGYAIQGIGGQFVEQIRGSFSAVVGLPLVETKQLLTRICKQ